MGGSWEGMEWVGTVVEEGRSAEGGDRAVVHGRSECGAGKHEAVGRCDVQR